MSETYRKKHQARQSADWQLDADGKPMGLIGPGGELYKPVLYETAPGGGVVKIQAVTRAEFTALAVKDPSTLYLIVDGV